MPSGRTTFNSQKWIFSPSQSDSCCCGGRFPFDRMSSGCAVHIYTLYGRQTTSHALECHIKMYICMHYTIILCVRRTLAVRIRYVCWVQLKSISCLFCDFQSWCEFNKQTIGMCPQYAVVNIMGANSGNDDDRVDVCWRTKHVSIRPEMKVVLSVCCFVIWNLVLFTNGMACSSYIIHTLNDAFSPDFILISYE